MLILKNISQRDKNLPSTFVSFLNYRKLINSKLDLTQINIFLDGSLIKSLVKFINPKADLNSYNFDFSNLAPEVISNGLNKFSKVILIGGTNEESKKSESYLRSFFKTKKIYVYDGYDNLSYFLKSPHKLNDSMLILSLGCPLQEKTAIFLNQTTKETEIYTSGAFVSQTSVHGVNYYNEFLIKFNLKFLQRLFLEKGHLTRVIKEIPSFFKLLCKLNMEIKTFN